jgi:hypothetical protein
MLSRIHGKTIESSGIESRPLSALTTQRADDPSIALLDASAVMWDVLTFYQERIANEGYLRSATERRSVLELARAIGYELKPGVAASAHLMFTVDEAPKEPVHPTVNESVGVMSIPGQDEKPQTFEPVERVETRPEWNLLRPTQKTRQTIGWGMRELYLKGVNTRLQPGDAILLVGREREDDHGSEHWDFRILLTVTVFPRENYTLVTWLPGLGHRLPFIKPAESPRVYAFRLRASPFGHNAPDPTLLKDNLTCGQVDSHTGDWTCLGSSIKVKSLDLDAVYPRIIQGSWVVLVKPGYKELYKVESVTTESRVDFTLVGKITHFALDSDEHLEYFAKAVRKTVVFAESEQLELADKPLSDPVQGSSIIIEGSVQGLERGRKLLIGGRLLRVRINDEHLALTPVGNRTITPIRGDFLDVLRTPSIDNEGQILWHLKDGKGNEWIAQTKQQVKLVNGMARIQKSGLSLIDADKKIGTRLQKNDSLKIIGLPRLDSKLRASWRLQLPPDRHGGSEGYLTVEPDELAQVEAGEDSETVYKVAIIKDAISDTDSVSVTLEAPLMRVYDRASVHIYANVALSTHGETIREVLGSGDGLQANQRFELRKPPLTYVSASTPEGHASTLKIYVNGVLWSEAESLYGLGPSEQCYILRIEDDGRCIVTFGDGVNGARLPSGVENVVATYRSGTGLVGEVGANKLALLQRKPLGLSGVTNPLPAGGAEDPEKLDDARINAPLTVLTFDRIVSIQDYTDFARAFPGVGKAQATVLWDGEKTVVHITVATASGKAIDPASSLYTNLVKAIDNVRLPTQYVHVADYRRVSFCVEANVAVDKRYVKEEILSKVKASLVDGYSYSHRDFGQPVTSSEIQAVIQGVQGVLFTNHVRIHLPGRDPVEAVPAYTARLVNNEILPAEILTIDGSSIGLTEVEA